MIVPQPRRSQRLNQLLEKEFGLTDLFSSNSITISKASSF